ncbi:MAG: OmpA family protein, partial [Rhodothermales bacterium]|nr:OmpA family protein [Rhodothermales bacterium]
APAALSEALAALEAAEAAWRQGRDSAEVSHHAFVARHRLRIAEEHAALRTTEQAIRQARMERYRVLLDLQAARAEAAARAARAAPTDTLEQAEQEPPALDPPPAAPPPAAAPPADADALGAVLTRRGLVLTLGDDLFTENHAALRPAASAPLGALVDFLTRYPERRVQIEGFMDGTGPRAVSLDHSRARVEAVRSALIERGIASSRITTRAYGPAHPVASNETAAGQRQNRRVEVVISDQQGRIPDRG